MLTDILIHVEHYRVPSHLRRKNGHRPKPAEIARYKRSGIDARPFNPAPTGGMTLAWAKIGDVTYQGVSFCSHRDTYNYRKGASIAKGRLLKAIANNNPL